MICDNKDLWNTWKFNLGNHQGYLKSNDIINLSVKRTYDNYGGSTQNGQVEFLRSHDIQFTVGDDTFQEVICYNERLDEVSKFYFTLFLLKFYIYLTFFFFSVVH